MNLKYIIHIAETIIAKFILAFISISQFIRFKSLILVLGSHFRDRILLINMVSVLFSRTLREVILSH